MPGKFLLTMLAFAGCAAFAPQAAAQGNAPGQSAIAGTVDFVAGDATIATAAGASRPARQDDAVLVGETITTRAGAEVHLRMVDGAFLSLRENSRITATAYVANGDDGDRSVITLAVGALRSVTGWIGRYRPDAYAVGTPTAVIGIRGTDHETMYLLPGDSRGEPGTYDKVNEGRTVLRSPYGSIDVLPNRVAHMNAARAEPPRLLAQVPAFFRPARNELRFVQRARASARTLDAQRNERRRLRGLPPAKPPAAAKAAAGGPGTSSQAADKARREAQREAETVRSQKADQRAQSKAERNAEKAVRRAEKAQARQHEKNPKEHRQKAP